jgi:hypothetical protein
MKCAPRAPQHESGWVGDAFAEDGRRIHSDHATAVDQAKKLIRGFRRTRFWDASWVWGECGGGDGISLTGGGFNLAGGAVRGAPGHHGLSPQGSDCPNRSDQAPTECEDGAGNQRVAEVG